MERKEKCVGADPLNSRHLELGAGWRLDDHILTVSNAAIVGGRGLISTNMSCRNSASQALNVSSPPPHTHEAPSVSTIGYCLEMSLFFCCSVLYSVGMRQKAFLSS